MQPDRQMAAAVPAADIREELWLLGQPRLSDYLDFVRRRVVGGRDLPRSQIVDAWRTANDHLAQLEDDEDGLADQAECLDLPSDMRAAADELSANAMFTDTFDRVPTQFAMIELDKIVVSQRHVTLPFVKDLSQRLRAAPGGDALFRLCQPIQRRDPPVSILRSASDRFSFVSDSSDLRFHDAALLSPDQISGHAGCGPVAGVIGLFVGHGSNFLSVIRSDDRMVLHNGYHRACALRMAGYTHAPAIVQTVSRRDELEIVAAPAVVEDPAFYFRARRPPLLKDFFDPQLSTVLSVRRSRRIVEVSFSIRESELEDI